MWKLGSFIFLTSFLALSGATADPVFKVVQKDGTVLYTDEPQQGAEEIQLDETTQNAVPALATKPIKRIVEPPAKQTTPDIEVNILTPEPEATIRSNQGNVIIKAQANTKAEGLYQLWFDGEAIKSNQTGHFKLDNIYRGAHDYQVKFIDNKGKTLASSPEQTLYLHQASILLNNNRQ